jgi:hypothetical protein
VHSRQEEKRVNILSNIVLIALLFQENKSFGASTICIHPLMYVKPCREQACTLLHRLQSTIGTHRPCSFLGWYQSDFTVSFAFMHITQASYSYPDGVFFSLEMFNAHVMLLQIFKELANFYFYTIVEIL